MQNKRRLSTALICAVLIIALAVVPMLTLTAFAEGENEVKLYGPAGKLYTLVDGKLPEVAEVPDGYTFLGWSDTEVTQDTITKPTIYNAGTDVTSGTYYTVFTKTVTEEKPDETVYQKTDIANITYTDVVVITMKNSAGVYALSNNNGTSSAPKAAKVTVSGNNLASTPDNTILWNIGGNSSGYILYPNGTTEKWLYSTSTNNGTRVGTNNSKTFVIDSTSGYLKHVGTSRYLGVYNSQDWRCYTNTTGNTAGQTLAFYVQTTTPGSTVKTIYYYGGKICLHENEVDSEPVNNVVTVSCGDCGAILYTKEFCSHANTATELVTATAIYEGYKIVTCVDCGEELSNEILSATCTHSYENVALAGDGSANICANCGHTKDRNIGSFSEGTSTTKFYIAAIRSSGNYFYMTNDLGTASTKRYAAVDSGLTELPETITGAEDSKIFVLEKNEDDTYKIYAEGIEGDDKYLGHSSGNSGILVSNTDALKLTVDVSNGTYNIHYTASDAERYLALNGNSGNNYFAFYKSGQKQDLTLIPLENVVEYPSLAGAQGRIGEDLGIKFYLNLPDGTDASKISLKITSGHGNVSTYTDIYTDAKGSYILYDGIAPQCMSDVIRAELYYGDESTPVDLLGYSFTEYLRKAWIDNPDNAELSQLIADLLAYGKAAQAYIGHKTVITDADIASYGAMAQYAPTDEDNVRAITGDKESSVSLTGVGVRFDVVNSIYVAVKGATADTKVVAGGKTYTVGKTGDVKIYLDATSVLSFGETVTIELYEGEDVKQTLTYSINSYCYSMVNKAAASAEMKALALALYNYGKSAENYAN